MVRRALHLPPAGIAVDKSHTADHQSSSVAAPSLQSCEILHRRESHSNPSMISRSQSHPHALRPTSDHSLSSLASSAQTQAPRRLPPAALVGATNTGAVAAKSVNGPSIHLRRLSTPDHGLLSRPKAKATGCLGRVSAELPSSQEAMQAVSVCTNWAVAAVVASEASKFNESRRKVLKLVPKSRPESRLARIDHRRASAPVLLRAT